ncbi:MAG: hypothetical protein HC869_06825 [Rhodospirillales bacterium]|nr:hypothetical protein [Rhodospirillales bacterium]
MQNVALQLGLALETRQGVRISRLQRTVLRCEGCRTVSRDTSKVFCPACGHASLERVSVTVDADGVEQFLPRRL